MRLLTMLRAAAVLSAVGVVFSCSEPTAPSDNNNVETGNGSGSGAGSAVNGQLSIWTDYTGSINVSVDGNSVGTVATAFSTTPACGQAGTVTITVPAGTHTIAGSGGGNQWSGSANVTAGQCSMYKLAASSVAPTTGRLSIWTDYTSPITVNVDGGVAGSLTTYFSNGAPACGQAGTLTITVPAGAHTVGGVSGSTTWNGSATVTAGGCSLFQLRAPANNGPSTGTLSIWTDYTSAISLKVDGAPVGNLTTYFASTTPACGQSGTVNVTLPAGTHTVSGISGSITWNGTATVTAGGCSLFKLSAPSGGSGGNSNTAQISIWTDYAQQIGVRVDGTSVGTLTQYFANGTPVCGQTGTLTISVPAGTHSVSGLSGTVTWNGTVTATAGTCTLFKLSAPASGGNPGSGGGNTAQLSVWTDYAQQIGVKVDGASIGTLTQYFANGTPACAQAGTLTVAVAPGTHSVSGVSGSTTWNGTVTTTAGGCTLFKLSAPAGGGNPGSGGSGNGQIAIWTNYPQQISVQVDGSNVGALTSYFPSGSPICGQSGTITISAAAGTHTVSGRAASATWNGTVTVVAGQCTLYELRGS